MSLPEWKSTPLPIARFTDTCGECGRTVELIAYSTEDMAAQDRNLAWVSHEHALEHEKAGPKVEEAGR